MAKTTAVWGIDIGQCALKAVRCSPHPVDPKLIVADAFDYIEYPKILSQPEADPAALVHEALELFLSRNSVREDRVAISVSGQSGLARFIKLPPVESKKIPDIVKYEAKQQIPFSLDDVVWDYQQMAGGSEDEGFALETEVGLFAMKRDQVFRALKPLDDVGIEVDYIQLTPLAIYNAIVFDQLHDLPPADEYDPDEPPESVVIISLGTENTDLVVTNGYRVWQRNIPLGGNHFTKALSKELKLTMAKAEHLKRNATTADDPKAVFQAMRPVFNDMLSEVQRSIGFFSSIDRKARIGRVVAMGNAMKLPGLQRFLSQNLGFEVTAIENYRGFTGPSVASAPAFRDNVLSFGVCYGLCLQGLNMAKLRTNLLPKELVTQRTIRDKKPWAVAALGGLLFGLMINYGAHWLAWNSAHPDYFAQAFPAADGTRTQSDGLVRTFDESKAEFASLDQIGQNLVSNVEGRMLWLEVLRAIDDSLPKEAELVDKDPANIAQRRELHIEQVDCERFEDLSGWFTSISKNWQEDVSFDRSLGDGPGQRPLAGAAPGPAATDSATPATTDPAAAPVGDASAETGPTGPGWVVQLRGYHYHNLDRNNQGAAFVRRTLLKNLKQGTVRLPSSPGGPLEEVKISDLGIKYPVLVHYNRIRPETLIDPNASNPETPVNGDLPMPQAGPMGQALAPEPIRVQRFDFIVQFAWTPTPPKVRKKNREEEAAAAQSAAPADGAAADPLAPGADSPAGAL